MQLAQQLYSTKIFVYKKCCIIMIKIGLAIIQKIHCTYYLCLISWKPIFFLFGTFLISHITFYNLLSPNLVVTTEQVRLHTFINMYLCSSWSQFSGFSATPFQFQEKQTSFTMFAQNKWPKVSSKIRKGFFLYYSAMLLCIYLES